MFYGVGLEIPLQGETDVLVGGEMQIKENDGEYFIKLKRKNIKQKRKPVASYFRFPSSIAA